MIYFQDTHVCIRSMNDRDPEILCAQEIAQGWHASADKYRMRLMHESQGLATTLVAECCGMPAGYINVYWHPEGGPFARTDIPEIVDFGVLEKFRCQGIGTRLMDAAEALCSARADKVYLGVGLHSGYGSAQRMYVKRGYVPDGSGVWYRDVVLPPYAPCQNDDDLVLYLAKEL